MGDIKRELFIFAASDINAMEEHFEEMARKGWMLDKVGEYSVRYKKTNPRELKFCIDMLPRFSTFDYPNNEDVLKYRNKSIEVGWQFIDSLQKFQVFYSDKEDNLPPIQRDDRIKQSIINKSLLFEIVIFIICFSIFIWGLCRLFPVNYNIFKSNIAIVITIIGPIFIIPIIVYIFSYGIWMIRANIAIKNGETLPKTNYKYFRYRTLLLLYPLLLFVLSIIIGSILDLLNGNLTGLLSILPTTIGFTAGTLFKKNKNRKKRSKDKNIAIFILLIIATVIGINVIMFNFINITESEELKEGYKGLRLSDFKLSSHDYSRFSREGSIVLPKYSTYYETTLMENRHIISRDYINTDYMKAVNDEVAKYIFDGMIEESITKYNRTLTPASKEYEHFDEAVFINYGNNDKDNKESIILLKGKEIFRINSSLNLSNKDNIGIITNKLNNQ